MSLAPPPLRTTEPGPPLRPERLTLAEAEALGERIQAQAAHIAAATCALLLMVADFDARGGTGWFVGLKSTAHWLAWACSMAPSTAREHVRVARALASMPRTVEEFRAGRLSYSKVREMTRLADRVDEQTLVEMARAMTASQLARTISSVRAVEGGRLGQDAVREARWYVRDDGMIEIRAVLPAEQGAELVNALELALDRDEHGPLEVDPDRPDRAEPPTGPEHPDGLPAAPSAEPSTVRAAERTTAATLEQRRADALLDLGRAFLDAAPEDRTGEDRHLVVVQVSAEALPRDVPAGTPAPPSENVPAGTPELCGVVGQGPLEVRTAERLACTGRTAVMITDAGGEVLHLGRSRRLASRAQRRALRMRDGTCTFPGCHQSRHLEAHHTVPWSEGGPTDIEGLALLCRRHHVLVHEGGLRLVRDAARAGRHGARFRVLDADGRPVQARWPAELEHVVLRAEDGTPRYRGSVDTAPGQDPARIAPTTGGAGFRLADCVDALLLNVVGLAA